MKYGCIGENLSHSFSREIHKELADYEYECVELAPGELETFVRAKDFEAINVTIPYKEKVVPYVDVLDESAESIGAVNTIVNRDGLLYGYNTDFYGMSELIRHAGASLTDKKVLVLGTGGTSRTACAVAFAEGAREVICVSRKAKGDKISYADAEKKHKDTEIIINTTPVGMYPRIFGKPISLKPFPKLECVIDVVYNPIRTPLVLAARERGISATGGLYMLVAQGVRASELFLDKKYDRSVTDTVYSKILHDKTNIVLVGMPSCGKSEVGRMIAEKLGRELLDTDRLAEELAGKSVEQIFTDRGEDVFRDVESLVTDRASARCGTVIATGGGTVLRRANVGGLRENGRIYFIDRPLELLSATSDRPTASTKEALINLYSSRYALYRGAATRVIDGSGSPEEVADLIIEDFLKA